MPWLRWHQCEPIPLSSSLLRLLGSVAALRFGECEHAGGGANENKWSQVRDESESDRGWGLSQLHFGCSF